jgi:RNA polymerase sigma factor (sigma-70 family)
MLLARAETLRWLSRAGDEAVAIRDPAQCLPGRICAAGKLADGCDRRLPESAEQAPLWNEAQETPEAEMLRTRDAATIRRLVAALADPFRETLVLREINDLSYREIAAAVGVPVGTVMSRLARARAMLRSAWMAEQEQPR